ncbi:acid-sensing ion channel 5 [Exaiptasia diaphana]|nr:acid-sensing ion channel 5 [Exaiptasia diaphana]
MANLTEFSQIKYCNPDEMISCGVYTMTKKKYLRTLSSILSTLTFGYRLPNNPQECGCPRPCKEIKYSTRVNDANFLTSDVFLDDVADSISAITKYVSRVYLKFLLDKKRDTVIHLSVHYEDLNRYITTERPSYDINLFGADVGGYIGLFLGCSVITIFEFIDLIIVCCLGRCLQAKTKERNTNDDEEQHDETHLNEM